MASRQPAPAAPKRRRKNPDQPGDSSRSREASEESNAETTEDAMGADDTDTGSFTAPTRRPPAASASAGGPSRQPQDGDAAGQTRTGLESTNGASLSTLDATGSPSASKQRRSSPSMAVDDQDGNESQASTYDGDISSAPKSSRRPHHHVHAAGDGSYTAQSGSAVTSGSGFPRSYYDGLATRSGRLQNMPSSSNISVASISPNSKNKDGSNNVVVPPDSPAPQIPHAPSTHLRHPSPGSPRGSTTEGGVSPMRPASNDLLKVPESKEAIHHPAPHGFLAKMSALDLQESVKQAIAGAGADGVERNYKINNPPTDRPVRIYADGVFDLFHYGHALALRQAKLAFPNVHLLVGVCSSELVRKHKAIPVMTSAERYESVRNCRWVDEVVEDAPWVVDQEFLDMHKIDYVAHDEMPYEGTTPGQSDIYRFVKDQGRFLPTRRTDGVSTSELLQRIVEGYRDGQYDKKLVKIGHPELCSNPPSERGSSNYNKDEMSFTTL